MKKIYSLIILCFSFFGRMNAQSIGANPENNLLAVNVYPTPTDGLLNIVFEEAVSVNPVIEVYNMIGSRITKIHPERESPIQFSINLSQEHSGLYLLKVKTDEGSVIKRFTLK